MPRSIYHSPRSTNFAPIGVFLNLQCENSSLGVILFHSQTPIHHFAAAAAAAAATAAGTVVTATAAAVAAATAGAETAAAAMTPINHSRMSRQTISIMFSDDTLFVASHNGIDAYLYLFCF